MHHQEGRFHDARGAEIYHQAWLPEGDPKASLIIVHGLAEHSGRYGNVVRHLVAKGYALYGFDLSGHGRSAGTRVYVDRLEDYTDTLQQYQAMVEDWQPGRPLFLLGHSVGGLIVPIYVVDHQERLAGAIVSAPMVTIPEHVSAFTIVLGRLLSRLLPKAGIVGIDAEGLSRDPAVVQAYVTDPLVYRGKTTARLAAELLRAVQIVNGCASQVELPLLILQGGDDSLVDPVGAQILHDSVRSVDKTLKVYAGLYHEVFNEPEHAQVLDDVLSWLEEHL